MLLYAKHELETVDAWFTVLTAVLLVLAGVVYLAMLLWCLRNGKGSFTGSYSWRSLFSISFQCSW
ncbi:MAG: hypothetical protein GX233_03515 [Erysipelothrix sp.]|nr:hypothetical protein [Erysipelothrix sp.]